MAEKVSPDALHPFVSAKVTDVSDEHISNANMPMEVTLAGIVTTVIEVLL